MPHFTLSDPNHDGILDPLMFFLSPSQLECLRKEKESATCRQSNLAGSDHEACLRRQTQRENAQLKVRITQLLKELEETRVASQQGCPSPDCVTRLQAKQIAKHVEQNRTLQVCLITRICSVGVIRGISCRQWRVFA